MEANLTAALLFGVERSRLVGRRLAAFVARDNTDKLHVFVCRVFEANSACSTELDFNVRSERLAVQIEAVVAPATNDQPRTAAACSWTSRRCAAPSKSSASPRSASGRSRSASRTRAWTMQSYANGIVKASRRGGAVAGRLMAFARRAAPTTAPHELEGMVRDAVGLLHLLTEGIQIELALGADGIVGSLPACDLLIPGAPAIRAAVWLRSDGELELAEIDESRLPCGQPVTGCRVLADGELVALGGDVTLRVQERSG